MLLFVALGPFARVAFSDNAIWAQHAYLSGMDGLAIGCLAALYAARPGLTHPAPSRRPVRPLLLAGTMLFVLAFLLRKATASLGLTALGVNVTVLEIGVASTWWRAGALTAASVLAILLSAMLGGLLARYYSGPMRRWLAGSR